MMNKLALIFSILAAITLVSCGEKTPVNELSRTKLAIEKARSVRADYYSPKEFSAAGKGLIKSHELLIKDEKPEETVTVSEEAYKNAVEAYNKSVILYAKDSLNKADKAVREADEAYAEKLSPTLFTQARDLYLAANDKYDNKNYEETVKLADESYEKALKAKNESTGNKYELQVKIDTVKSVMHKIESYEYRKYASQEYGIASANLKNAEKSYSEDKLKKGFGEAEVAKINADAAYKAVMSGVCSEKIAKAEKMVQTAESSKGAEVASEDLAAAKEALQNSRNLKDKGNYSESMTYADEAIRLSNSVISEGEKAVNVATVKAKEKEKAVKKESKYYYYKVKTWIKYKDCLWKIARKYYKNPRLWKKIHRANKGRIKNPDVIRPGWIIRVPKLKK